MPNPFANWTQKEVDEHNARVAHNRKASDTQIISAYQATGSVWKAAEQLGMCGQSVHERLVILGIDLPNTHYSADEQAEIKSVYESGLRRGDGKLDALAAKLQREKSNICRFARQQGWTRPSRELTEEQAANLKIAQRKHIAEHGHPRGMLGHKHTDSVKELIGHKSAASQAARTPEAEMERVRKILQTKTLRGISPRARGSWKAGWRTIGNKHIFLRSRWEANYARYLEALKIGGFISEWLYECETFWFDGVKRGCVSYKPDFKVIKQDGTFEFHEVKGWMDAKSITKIKRMKKYHPTITLIVRDASWFKANRSILRALAGSE